MKPIIILFILSILLNTACKKGYLDKTPDGDLTIDQVFQNREYTERFLANVYSALPRELVLPDNLSNPLPNPFMGASDELEMSYEPSFSNNLNSGTWNQSTYTHDAWSHYYIALRKANVFIENIDKLPVGGLVTEELKQRWKAEAIFLRAFYHFLLIRLYGPVPIMDKSVSLGADYNSITRQPIDKCVAFIVDNCDAALAALPAKWIAGSNAGEFGRPTKASALALKSRVLLYMASPLWNGNPDVANLSNKDGVKLFPAFSADRWKAAADAARECIVQSESAGYKLYRSAGNDPVANYQETFYIDYNDEVLFARPHAGYYDFDIYSEPRGMPGIGFSLNSPTQEIVDEYEMAATGQRPILGYNADKSPIINPGSGYVETGNTATETSYYVAGTRNMYVGRDPRFYASIMFTGAKFKWDAPHNRTTPLEFWKGGLDGRPTNNQGNYSETGYLLKKLTHPAYQRIGHSGPHRNWIFFRLGEQYLNYAEALNEAEGPIADVYKYINLIRRRVNMPDLPSGLSKEAMRDAIRHERRIELAFETHRFFDTHRWKIAEVTDNTFIHGLQVDFLYPGNIPFTMSDNAFYVRTPVEKRVFDKKHYLWPIPLYELEKNKNLVQNPGW
ncbi:RagB/SusD family nutrient uptake outer membrane protein [Paradesertivirga mongoliensis]|uniref:RagB/SusD family nutrient uptake outer membrane protein n=1 Tax=Paradesertivirga mongoliensis TaxID=2100740 RepID=A0ABW4ZR89_9SPHI|nr:RagB/SusD family nutrient uptake outer membrane protein [Pedobacter mongoliensis]